MRVEVKVEDLQIGDQMYPRRVLDLFYKMETLASTTQKKAKGLVVVVFDDYSTKAFPIGHVLKVYRKD